MTGATLDWPATFEQTNPTERTRNNRYEASLRTSIDDLEAELERVGVDDWRLSTAARHQKQNPKYPYADASPNDPSAVVRWTMDGDQYAVACDAYSRLRDNVRTLYLYLREKRKMEQRPVVTGESEFANARLPPADESVVAAPDPTDEPHEVLGVAPDAPDAVVQGAFRELVKEHHPDHGGSKREFTRLMRAREVMLDD
ncbi:J domain-containing protein [Haladaptatus sp. AB618]|uniref:J domain-containing protein n=1 Tax=Haladaptatus sp. AB618 TaxID=2934173 RepID=UPI00209C360A|nr:J domain-containing protein [Haladaptatus sp. AB618]MCO8254514.1 J domain-containing protein [Haladaptatus sp. AB618]